jgi:hypothetical protein
VNAETIIGLVGLAAALGVAWPVLRSKQTSATIELLRSELTVEKDARLAQEQRCAERMAEQDRRHSTAIAELRGQVSAMTPEFARTLAGLLKEEGVHG